MLTAHITHISEESEILMTMFDPEVKVSCILFKNVFTCLLWIIETVPRKMETEDQHRNMKDKN